MVGCRRKPFVMSFSWVRKVFRRPRQKQDDPLKGSLSENILTMLCRANCWQSASLGAFQEADRGLYVEKKFQALVPGEHKP